MSQLKLSNYQVNRFTFTRKENFDVEKVSVNPPTPTNLSDVVNATTQQEGAEADASDDGDGGICGSSSVMSKYSSLFGGNKKKTAVITTALVAGGLFGVSFGSSRAVEHKQPTALALNTVPLLTKSNKYSNSKSAKSCFSGRGPVIGGPQIFCKEPKLKCGSVITNQKVVLSDDIFCTDEVFDATPTQLKTLNAAIKLSGPDASIDCKGRTIRQRPDGTKFAAACETFPGDSFDPSEDRKMMKENCELFYEAGILLVNGATAVNCKVEQFYKGILVQNGGQVKKSEVSGNRFGVFVQHDSGSIATKISDVYSHGNGVGIGIYVSGAAAGAAIIVEDVTSKHNVLDGFIFSGAGGAGVTVKDSTTSFNGQDGIFVNGVETNPTKVQFEGIVSSHHNGKDGVFVQNFVQEVTVNGELNTYLNEDDGLHVFSSRTGTNVSFNVGLLGRFNSCKNKGKDVKNEGTVAWGTFKAGSDFGYTCVTQAGPGLLPTCADCTTCTF